MRKNQSIEKPKLIIGEGKDEEYFFSALIKYLEIDNIQVNSYGGKTNLNNYLNVLRSLDSFSNLRSLLITRDADNSFEDTYKSIDGSMTLIKERENLKIKTFIFPDNKSSGMLEDLCLKAIDGSDIDCIEEFFQCVKKNTSREPNEFSKAKIHAWLSTQLQPYKRLGEAAKSGYIDWKNENFNDLINFIKSL